jgi:O-methyltransferase
MTDSPTNGAADAYLDLLARCLTRSLLPEEYEQLGWTRSWRQKLLAPAQRVLAQRGLEIVRRVEPPDFSGPPATLHWPARAETMISPERLANVRWCVTDVITRGVPGDVIETGVWRGGATIMMRAVLRAHGVTDRFVWVADSFRGLPKPDATRWPADGGLDLSGYSQLAVSAAEVRANFERYGLLDEQVRLLEGWFEDTLPTAPIAQLAVLRLDGDLYGSTIVALEALYPKLSKGGYVIVDDYGEVPACRRAVEDYRGTNGITAEIQTIDSTGVFWQA